MSSHGKMWFYTLLLRFPYKAGLKFGITKDPLARIKSHRASSENPFLDKPRRVVVVGGFSGAEPAVREWERSLKSTAVRLFERRSLDACGPTVALPIVGAAPSGEWLEVEDPEDAPDLIDAFNWLAASAGLPRMLIGHRCAAIALRAFEAPPPVLSIRSVHA